MAKEAKKVQGPVKVMAKLIKCEKIEGKDSYSFKESLLTYEEALKLANEVNEKLKAML